MKHSSRQSRNDLQLKKDNRNQRFAEKELLGLKSIESLHLTANFKEHDKVASIINSMKLTWKAKV